MRTVTGAQNLAAARFAFIVGQVSRMKSVMDSVNSAAVFKIWGVDDVVYGPVDLPTVVDWIGDERVTAETWIYHALKEEWLHAREVPEFKPFFTDSPDFPGGSRNGGTEHIAPLVPGVRPGTLRRVKILSDMNDQQLGRFAQMMEVQNVRQFAEIVKLGQPGGAMFLVLEGQVRVRLMIDTRETTLATLEAGEFFGETSLFDEGPRSADVVANTDCVLLKISHSSFIKLAKERPEVATPFLLGMGRTLAARIRADNKRLRESITMARATR
jgi:CRP-like cAMP-binding protein